MKGELKLGECYLTLNGKEHHYDNTDEALAFTLSADGNVLTTQSATLKASSYAPPVWRESDITQGILGSSYEISDNTLEGNWKGHTDNGGLMRIDFYIGRVSVVMYSSGPMITKTKIIDGEVYTINGNTITAGDYTLTMTPKEKNHIVNPDREYDVYSAVVAIKHQNRSMIRNTLVEKTVW